MGLFNSYLKPGPGIEKDAPKKKGLFLYLELFSRKFFKIVQANALYFALSIPMILLVYTFVPVSIITRSTLGIESDPNKLLALEHNLRSLLAMLALTFFGSGPASAGLAYIYRCITREEHAWIWSDFFQKIKENLKQSIVVIIVAVIAVFLASTAIYYYYNMYIQSQNMLFAVLLYVVSIAFLIFTLMHIHIYQLMITYECKIIDLYKNAFVIAFAKLPLNLILSIISILITLTLFIYIEATFSLFLFLILFYSIVRFPLDFYAARTINRLIDASSRGENE